MAILEILHFPDPRLRVTASPVTRFDAALAQFVADLFETMYEAPGVGLAATQVGDNRRVAVMNCADDKSQPMVICNPEILWRTEPVEVDEGCLSVPGYTESVTRYRRLGVRAQDETGEPYELEARDLLAQCVQHELAHLDGGLYIDKLSRLKRDRIRRKMEKTARHEHAG